MAYDRRGWGRTEPPEPYLRTTVQEQAEDAVRLLQRLEATAVACGAGLGAVVALDLMLRHPELTRGTVLIEPPLLAFVEEATEALSEDGGAMREEVHGGGPAAGVELYLSGTLTALGPGADRLPQPLAAPARARPLSLFAELSAVPAWPLPLAEMTGNLLPARIVISRSTPNLLRRAAEELAGRLTHAELHRLPDRGRPAHLEDPRDLATLIAELL
jgi:pimeloyl-ACP methyl ester carboxylesterase